MFTKYEQGVYTFVKDGISTLQPSGKLYALFESVDNMVDPTEDVPFLLPVPAIDSLRRLAAENNDCHLVDLMDEINIGRPRLLADYPVQIDAFDTLGSESRKMVKILLEQLYQIALHHLRLPAGQARSYDMITLSSRLLQIINNLPLGIAQAPAINYDREGHAFALTYSIGAFLKRTAGVLPSDQDMRILIFTSYYYLRAVYEIRNYEAESLIGH